MGPTGFNDPVGKAWKLAVLLIDEPSLYIGGSREQYDPSFDAMIRLFLQKYDIATKRDINRLTRKIEDLEKALSKKPGAKKSVSGTRKRQTATETVMNAVRDMGKDGANVAGIKEQTGYEDKKVRNIVNRLNKEGKIKRIKRGVYVAG